MPTVVKGVADARRILRKIDPELYKEMNSRIITAMAGIRDIARGQVPDQIFGLRNFSDTGFQRQSRTSRARAFPMYNPTLVRKGLTYSTAKKKASPSGFSALYAMLNKNAAGAIIETAGRLNMSGDPASQSNNPGAGAHFINALDGQFGTLQRSGTTRKTEGRLMASALASRKSNVQHEILKAIDDTIKTLQREVDAA